MTKKILVIIALVTVFLIPIKAQVLSRDQLDSLYNLYIRIKTHAHPGIQSAGSPHIKCAFGIISQIKFNYNRFNTHQQALLKPLISRPVTDTSFVTPNGFFRVHYDISGPDKPVYNLDSLGIALDSAYNFEVNYLGYPPPPSDNGAGGDNKYDIYIIDPASMYNAYGNTTPETEVVPGSGRYTSFMEIASDFSTFSNSNLNLNYNGPNGINAARVTVAHEFHHAIQIGDYIYRYDLDEFFYELTSTSMEHFVYPSIHDYYQYLPSYFQNTQYSLGENGGLQEYALAIWNIFLQENFGYDIIKKQWELMPKERAIQAISDSFADYKTSFAQQFNLFGIWTYFTNYRAYLETEQHFMYAADYPLLQPVISLDMNSASIPVQINTPPVTNSFIQIINRYDHDNRYQDTIIALVSNDDIQNVISNPDSLSSFQYILYDSQNNGAEKLGNSSYYYSLNVDKPSFWIAAAIINNQRAAVGNYFVQNIDYAFPAPFYYNKNTFIYIPAVPDQTGNADVNIYTSSMKLVYSGRMQVIPYFGHKVIQWKVLDNQNKKLASGVYIYVTKSGDNITKGKLVIFQ